MNNGETTTELDSQARRYDELTERISSVGGPADLRGAGLAKLQLWLGQFARARSTAERVIATNQGDALDRSALAHALGALVALEARFDDLDRAFSLADDAIGHFRVLEQPAYAAHVMLDLAEALLRRDGPADLSAAVARLAAARSELESGSVRTGEARNRLMLLLAWARGATGDLQGGLEEFDKLCEALRPARHRDLAWQAYEAAARLHELRGAEVHARRSWEHAMELLEDIATSLPREMREGFWRDPRRAEVRSRASTQGVRNSLPEAASANNGRWTRLLELTSRLASEHEPARVLERINDSAVELSGAERGFVLLLDEDGKLVPVAVRDAKSPEDPHIAFSLSIAEAVLIDREPIVTVDARADTRLSEYMSVHKLMLQSVACLPIRDRDGILGVLYVEHRVRRGRFGPSDVELLLAFADQAGIALSNARLIKENEQRRLELEAAYRSLEEAHREIERVLAARTAELEETRHELTRTRQVLRGDSRYGIVGKSAGIRKVLAVVERIRDATVPVVIHGESGTGKELVARAIHGSGNRASGPFVALNCAAIPNSLLESELFGHVRGAFTGAERDRVGVIQSASGGTLFLDEIGDMPAKMQVDLLRVLQEGKIRPIGANEELDVDVRVVCASNKVLSELVDRGEFREDLYYRLSVIQIRLPPLRDRRDDIPLLVHHFLAAIAKRDDSEPRRISRDAMMRLMTEPFPGNIRQLEHVLMNACVMSQTDTIEAADLTLLGAETLEVDWGEAPGEESAANEPIAANLDEWKAQERNKILEALEATGWNRVRAAQQLGIPRRTFYRRLREYAIL